MSEDHSTVAIARTSYDAVPYESSSFPQTHPDRLATLARISGLAPAAVERCRVLDLGCAMGANLLPMAFNLPESEFVGVDSSGRQVAAACAQAEALRLKNVRIENASILEVDPTWGTFDYIICHGVYSWVPQPVQEGILKIACRNLAPQGIAYISYNTYPGWHMREMIRHMMRYHESQFSDVSERIEQARALLEFLAENVDGNCYYGAFLRSELQLVSRARDSYLFHEHLEEVNTPLYFHEFMGRAGRHRLRYLAEAEFSSMVMSGFPAQTAETLDRISPDILHAEQYMDFLRNRFFRQTLLCHAGLDPKRKLEAGDLNGLLLASPLVPDGESGESRAAFRAPDGRQVNTAFGLTQAALTVLGECWPVALDQETLRASATERLTPMSEPEEFERQWAIVLEDMLHCYAKGALELHSWQAPFTTSVTERPRVTSLVARQAITSGPVTNQRHEAVRLDPVGRCLAPLLDGTRDHEALLSELIDCVTRGELALRQEGLPVTEREAKQAMEIALGQALLSFAKQALLVD